MKKTRCTEERIAHAQRQLRILTVVDSYTWECLAIEVE
jgi:hypothetical protein